MEPLFKVGDFEQIGLSSEQTARGTRTSVLFDSHKSKSFKIKPPPMNLTKSKKKWGLYLTSLTLKKSFEGFIENLFNPQNEIYFTSIVWDYSGAPPFVYPPKGANAPDFLISLKPPDTRKFVANGVNIWPPSVVVGSLNVVILIYECDKEVCDWGTTLTRVHDEVAKAELANLIEIVSATPSLVAGSAIVKTVNELVGAIGNFMKRNKNDSVDLFEGSYGMDKPQSSRMERYDQKSAGIELDFTVS